MADDMKHLPPCANISDMSAQLMKGLAATLLPINQMDESILLGF